MQIVVLGMHRSGTSAVTGLLVKMGAYFGAPEGALPKNFDNPRGFWERTDVMTLNDEMLLASGADWLTPQLYDSEKISASKAASFCRRVRVIAAELSAQPVSVVKDPRLCITADEWLPHLPQHVCLLVLRNPLAVAKSLQKRNALPLSAGLALWEAYTLGAVRASAASPRIVLDFDALMTAPSEHAAPLFAALQRTGAGTRLKTPSESDLKEALDAGLQHHTPVLAELRQSASPEQLRLFEQLQNRAFDAIAAERLSDASRGELDTLAGRGRLLAHRCKAIALMPYRLAQRALRNGNDART